MFQVAKILIDTTSNESEGAVGYVKAANDIKHDLRKQMGFLENFGELIIP